MVHGARRQAGRPVSDERLRELIASGVVRGDTLVWSAGMTNWIKAADVPGLMPARRVPSVAPLAPGSTGHRPVIAPCRRLGTVLAYDRFRAFDKRHYSTAVDRAGFRPVVCRADLGAWYAWRKLRRQARGYLVGVCSRCAFPWPRSRRLGLPAARARRAENASPLIFLLVALVSLFLGLLTIRWIFASIVWESQQTRLRFTGGYWPLLDGAGCIYYPSSPSSAGPGSPPRAHAGCAATSKARPGNWSLPEAVGVICGACWWCSLLASSSFPFRGRLGGSRAGWSRSLRWPSAGRRSSAATA